MVSLRRVSFRAFGWLRGASPALLLKKNWQRIKFFRSSGAFAFLVRMSVGSFVLGCSVFGSQVQAAPVHFERASSDICGAVGSKANSKKKMPQSGFILLQLDECKKIPTKVVRMSASKGLANQTVFFPVCSKGEKNFQTNEYSTIKKTCSEAPEVYIFGSEELWSPDPSCQNLTGGPMPTSSIDPFWAGLVFFLFGGGQLTPRFFNIKSNPSLYNPVLGERE